MYWRILRMHPRTHDSLFMSLPNCHGCFLNTSMFTELSTTVALQNLPRIVALHNLTWIRTPPEASLSATVALQNLTQIVALLI
eukprot:jgi/Botrbrau1/316/Bobra.0022s0278.1